MATLQHPTKTPAPAFIDRYNRQALSGPSAAIDKGDFWRQFLPPLRLPPSRSFAVILEIGSGTGEDAARILQMAKHPVHYIANEIAPRARDLLHRRLLPLHQTGHRIEILEDNLLADQHPLTAPLHQQADLVITLGVTGHLPNLNRLAQLLRHCVRPGGYALLSLLTPEVAPFTQACLATDTTAPLRWPLRTLCELLWPTPQAFHDMLHTPTRHGLLAPLIGWLQAKVTDDEGLMPHDPATLHQLLPEFHLVKQDTYDNALVPWDTFPHSLNADEKAALQESNLVMLLKRHES